MTADPAVVADVRDHLGRAPLGADLLHIEDASSAMSFLRADENVLPELVLVDFDEDEELLQKIAADPQLEQLTVVALAADPAAADELLARYRLHDVVGKPPGPEGLLRVLSFMDEL